MNEEEEDMLYREMNEEDPFYMGPSKNKKEQPENNSPYTEDAKQDNEQQPASSFTKKEAMIYAIVTFLIYLICMYFFITRN